MVDTILARLCIQDAVVKFGDLHVLGPLSFEVRQGECVVLLGPSGCGKSTLLAALSGLHDLSSGTVSAGANPPGFVFQEPNLMGWASVSDNVALPLALTRISQSKRRERVKSALERVGLEAFAQARPRALSGGMAMRVALARALISEPRVLLLDEPFGAIDELGRRALNDLVHHAKHERQMAILFVTHSVEEAVYMADRILVMSPRPGTIFATIEVPALARNEAFLVSHEFALTVASARRALAAGLVGAT